MTKRTRSSSGKTRQAQRRASKKTGSKTPGANTKRSNTKGSNTKRSNTEGGKTKAARSTGGTSPPLHTAHTDHQTSSQPTASFQTLALLSPPSPGPLGVRVLAVLVVAATFCAYLARTGYPFELLSHFRPHYALLGLVLALVLLATRQWRWAVLSTLGAGANVVAMYAPYLVVAPDLPASADTVQALAEGEAGNSAPVTIVFANVGRRPAALEALSDLATRAGAQSVVIAEMPSATSLDAHISQASRMAPVPTGAQGGDAATDAGAADDAGSGTVTDSGTNSGPNSGADDLAASAPRGAPLVPPLAEYSCVTHDDPDAPYSITILSKPPCQAAIPPVSPSWPNATQRAMVEGDLTLVGVHAARPVDLDLLFAGPSTWAGANQLSARDAMLDAAAQAARTDAPAVLLGDMNAAPWSPKGIELAGRGLDRVRCGGPWRTTWPNAALIVGLPIDQAYVTRDLAANCRIGPNIGADHRPLIVTVGPRPPQPERDEAGRTGSRWEPDATIPGPADLRE